MFDAEDELAILSGEMMAERTLGEDDLREPIGLLGLRPAETIVETGSIAESIAKMKRAKIGSLAVVDDDGHLVGIVTERDLLQKVLLEPIDLAATAVRTIMTPDPETLHPEDLLIFVMNKMHVGGFRHVPIVDQHNRPLHVVGIRDVVAFVLRAFEPMVANVPPDVYPHLRRFA